MTAPIKRHPALQPLSREHHHDLMLCWKIRRGLALQVDIERINAYVAWYFNEYIVPHFKEEETHIFPLLGMDHKLVKKAVSQHRRLTRLFNKTKDLASKLTLIEKEFWRHVRFEERELFNEIQKRVSAEKLEQLREIVQAQDFKENTTDLFWKVQ